MWKNNCKNGPGYFISEDGKYTSAIYKNDRVESVLVEAPAQSHRELNGIENHYHSLLEVKSLVTERLMEDIGLVCLRFNSQLKSWYREHSTVSNDKYVTFMCAGDFWGFVRQFKLLDLGDGLATLNRMLFSNLLTRALLKILPHKNF